MISGGDPRDNVPSVVPDERGAREFRTDITYVVSIHFGVSAVHTKDGEEVFRRLRGHWR